MSEPKEIYCCGRLNIIAADAITAETVTIVADVGISTISLHAGVSEGVGGPLTLAAIAARLEVARNLVVTITDADASLTAGFLVVAGLDASGYPVREVFTIAAGTATYTGNVAFSEVSSAIIYGFAGETADDDKIKIGVGNKIGLPMGKDCILLDVYKARHNGANEAVLVSGVNKTYGTYAGTSAAGADHAMEFWYTFKRMLNW